MPSLPQTVIFLHIPKAAGTTLHRVLERQYSPAAIFSIGSDAHASIREFKELPDAQRAAIRLFRGHMPYGLHSYLPQPATYFTILREPIERVISYYHYILRTPAHYLHDTVVGQKMSLKALLESGLPIMMNDTQVRLISGVWADVGFGECTPDILEMARHHLAQSFRVVGLAEQFDATLLMLKQTYGWGRMFYVRENVGRGREVQSPYDADTLTLIRQVNQLDQALYSEAQALFTQQIQQQGASFSAQLAWFRLSNWLYQEIRTRSLRAWGQRLVSNGWNKT